MFKSQLWIPKVRRREEKKDDKSGEDAVTWKIDTMDVFWRFTHMFPCRVFALQCMCYDIPYTTEHTQAKGVVLNSCPRS